MGSESSLRLPVIDFSEINELKSSPAATADGHHWNSVRTQVMEALEEYGCFEVVYDYCGVSSELHDLIQAIYAVADELLNLPLETKQKNKSPGKFQRGYIAPQPMLPLFESIVIDEADILEKAESFTKLMFPEGNANICKVLHSYAKQVSELDQMVRMMILESLGVEKYYNEHIESTKYVLKIQKYNAPETNESSIGLVGHTDMNMVTILSQLNQVDGLEVQTKTGEWIKAKPSPNSFTVVIGDAMMACTNGRLNPPFHRVMMTGDKTRYMSALFAIPRAKYMMKAPEELVDEEHPLLYRPYYHEEFMDYIFEVKAQQTSKLALKDFCGVCSENP